MRARGVVTLAAWAWLSATACYVPVSGSAPLGAKTAGKGQLAATAVIEYPVIDQLATTAQPPDAAAPNRYPRANAPYAHVQLSYGLTQALDIDLGLTGELQAILPLPHGAFVGARYVPVRTGAVHLGVGLAAGYAGFGASTHSEPFEGRTVTAYYAALSASATIAAWRRVRPVIGLTVLPIHAQPHIDGVDAAAVRGLGASLTAGLAIGPLEVGTVRVRSLVPFATAGVLTSDNVRGTDLYVTAGLAKGL